MATDLVPDGYDAVLRELKARLRAAQLRAQRVVNTQMIELYWSVGQTIAQQQASGWGSKVLDLLAADLKREFPDATGFSRRNLAYMAQFARAWPEPAIVQQAVAQLPWGHVTVLLSKLDSRDDRDWYAASAATFGWSRSVLEHHISTRTRDRIGAAPSNFDLSLPPGESDLAKQLAKDPYVLDFLNLAPETAERELEQALMDRLVETLGELGSGFAFLGRQVHIEVDGDDFYIDLLFFHVDQLRHVVVELKVGKFKPEYLGQLGFYISSSTTRLRNRSTRRPSGSSSCRTATTQSSATPCREPNNRSWSRPTRTRNSHRRSASSCPTRRPSPVRSADSVRCGYTVGRFAPTADGDVLEGRSPSADRLRNSPAAQPFMPSAACFRGMVQNTLRVAVHKLGMPSFTHRVDVTA